MRYRLLASYQGAPYEAGVGPTDTDVVLFAACPPPEELRFEPATGHWRKRVRRDEIQTLHESRPVGLFRGDRCIVLDDLGDRLHIAYLGHDAYRAEQLGYWEVDRGVFELVTPRQDVTDITEQRLPVPHNGGETSQAPAQLAPLASPPFDGPPFAALPFDAPPLDGQSSDASSLDTPSLDTPSLDTPPSLLTVRSSSGAPLAGSSAVAIPAIDEPPLPLEAEARRAAAASQSAKASHVSQAQPALQSESAVLPQVPLLPEQPVSLSEPLAGAHQAGQETPVSALPSWTPPSLTPAPVPPAPVAPAHVDDAATELPLQGPPDLNPPASPISEPEAQLPAQFAPAPTLEPTATAMTPPSPGTEASTLTPPETMVTTTPQPSVTTLTPPAPIPDLMPHTAPAAAQPPTAPPAPARRRRSTRRRLPTQRIFSDLASQAAIPASAYAIGDEVDGAMCLMSTDEGFEVFNSVGGARHEIRIFQDEESAYFYLFGVLVADAVRTGALAPRLLA